MMSNNAFMAGTCIVGVVVTNESNIALYFPKAWNLNGSNADMCSDVAGPLSSSLGVLFKLSNRSNKTDPESIDRATHGWTSWLSFLIWAWLQLPYRLSGRVTSLCIRSIVLLVKIKTLFLIILSTKQTINFLCSTYLLVSCRMIKLRRPCQHYWMNKKN